MDTEEFLVEDSTITSQNGISVFKLLGIMTGAVVLFFVSSAIVCAATEPCHDNVPSLRNLLQSPITAPYAVIGLCTAIGIHFVVVFVFYLKSAPKAQYASKVQLFAAFIMYGALGLVLFIFPFSPYQNYGAIILLIAMALWMLSCMFVLKKLHHYMITTRCMGLHTIIFFVYIVCAAVYMGLRFGTDNDTGVLIIEILCGLSIMLYMCLCVYHVGNVRIITTEPIVETGPMEL